MYPAAVIINKQEHYTLLTLLTSRETNKCMCIKTETSLVLMSYANTILFDRLKNKIYVGLFALILNTK